MAGKLDPRRLAIGLGCFVALLDLLWVIVVASGYAQSMVSWKMSLLFMTVPLVIGGFEPLNALLSIVLSFLGGAVLGWLFAVVWNYSARFK